MGDGHTLGCFSSGDIVAPVELEVCDGSHRAFVMKKGRPEEWGGVHTHTFAKNANVWGTRRVEAGASQGRGI